MNSTGKGNRTYLFATLPKKSAPQKLDHSIYFLFIGQLGEWAHIIYFPITNHIWHSLFSSCKLCVVGMICETNVGRIVVDVLTLLVITFYTLSCHSQCLDIQSDKTGNDVEWWWVWHRSTFNLRQCDAFRFTDLQEFWKRTDLICRSREHEI